MASRLPKGNKTIRAHVQMPEDWCAYIDYRAAKLNVSRSSFIANAALVAAKSGLTKADLPKAIEAFKASQVSAAEDTRKRRAKAKSNRKKTRTKATGGLAAMEA